MNVNFDANGEWQKSDIDIFLVGMKAEAFDDKIREIYRSLQQANEHELLVVRTKNCISFVSQFPYRTVQVISHEYESYVDVLAAFDLDCVSIGFNGKEVLAAPNAVRGLNTRTNFLEEFYFGNEAKLSTLARIRKYQQRGFSAKLYNQDFLQIRDVSPRISSRLLFLRWNGKKEKKIGNRTNSEDDGGYDNAYLPYGPTHTATSIRQSLSDNHKNFFIFGTLDYCLTSEHFLPSR